MRFFAVIMIWIFTLSEAPAGVIIEDIAVQAGIFSREINNFPTGAELHAGTDWGVPVSSGESVLDLPALYANTSRVAFDFQESGQNSTLDFTWDHSIAGGTNDEAYGRAYVFLRPEVDLRYEVSGMYAVNGAAASYQNTVLQDADFVNPPLLSSFKESRSTPNENLTVGSLVGGDFANNVSGTLTGDLLAGQLYVFDSLWYLHAYTDSAPSIATGNLRLSLSPMNTAAVPEPSSLLLLGIGTCSVFARARRKKRSAS